MIDNEKILLEIGQRLRKLRLDAGYSSYENFAFSNDLSRVHYGRLEKGNSNITMNTLIKILNIHNTSLEQFFKGL